MGIFGILVIMLVHLVITLVISIQVGELKKALADLEEREAEGPEEILRRHH